MLYEQELLDHLKPLQEEDLEYLAEFLGRPGGFELLRTK